MFRPCLSGGGFGSETLLSSLSRLAVEPPVDFLPKEEARPDALDIASRTPKSDFLSDLGSSTGSGFFSAGLKFGCQFSSKRDPLSPSTFHLACISTRGKSTSGSGRGLFSGGFCFHHLRWPLANSKK